MSTSNQSSGARPQTPVRVCAEGSESGPKEDERENEPIFLAVNTDVSAKYKGAFCEAKIKSVNKCIKCRITYKSASNPTSIGSILVTDDLIKGQLKVGAVVEVHKPNHNPIMEATIQKIFDSSQYTVVFDDGDETTLRRTSLCLKSGKHYSESESLDHLPLTNPEHFGNPVSMKRRRRGRKADAHRGLASSASRNNLSSIASDDEDYEELNSLDENATIDSLDMDDDIDNDSNITQQSSTKDASVHGKDAAGKSTPSVDVAAGGNNSGSLIGKVFIVEYNLEKRGNKAKDFWFPALCVHPSSQETLSLMSINVQQTLIKIDQEKEVLVRSFKDNKFHPLSKDKITYFDKEIHSLSKLNDSNSSAALRNAIDKTLNWLERSELPAMWNFDILLQGYMSNEKYRHHSGHGRGHRRSGSAKDVKQEVADEDEETTSEMDADESNADDDSKYQDTSSTSLAGVVAATDEQQNEEKDRFVAQLFKFMDERGTPMNKTPNIHGKDVDLYKLYVMVNKHGGYNKICNKNEWKSIFDTVHGYQFTNDVKTLDKNELKSGCEELKVVYKKFLLNFTDFYRKLGYSSAFINSNVASRSSTRPARNERSWARSSASVSNKDDVQDQSIKAVEKVASGKPGRRKKSISVDTRDKDTDKDIDMQGPPSNDPSSSVTTDAGDDGNDGNGGKTSSTGRRGSMKKGRRGGRRKVDSTDNLNVTTQDADDDTNQDTVNANVDVVGASGNAPGPDDETDPSIPHISDDVLIDVGDKLRVRYTKGTGNDVFEVKVMKVRTRGSSKFDTLKDGKCETTKDGSSSIVDVSKQEYYVHYSGWNSRYDEWIKRHRIVEVVGKESSATANVGTSSKIPVSKQDIQQSATILASPQKCTCKRSCSCPKSMATKEEKGYKECHSSQSSTAGSIKGSGSKVSKGSEVVASQPSPVPVIKDDKKVAAEDVETPKGKKSSTISSVATPASAPGVKVKKQHWKHRVQAEKLLLQQQKEAQEKLLAENVADAEQISAKEGIKSSIKHEPVDEVEDAQQTTAQKVETRKSSIDTDAVVDDQPTSRRESRHEEHVSKRGLKRGASKDETSKEVSSVKVPSKISRSRDISPESGSADKRSIKKSRKYDEALDSASKEKDSVSKMDAKSSSEEDEKSSKKRKKDIETDAEVLDDKKRKKSKVEVSKIVDVETPKSSSSKKRRKDKDTDCDDVNQEIARLFEPNKITTDANKLSKDGQDKDVPVQGDDLLLCKEDIPMSPVAGQSSVSTQPPNVEEGDAKDCRRRVLSGSNQQQTPPATPESLRSGTLSSLSPPNESSKSQSASLDKKDADHVDGGGDKKRTSKDKDVESDDSSKLDTNYEGKGGANSSKVSKKVVESVAASPKRKRRGGRMRTLSASESVHQDKDTSHHHQKKSSSGYKTRGASGRKKALKSGHETSMIESDRYSPLGHDVHRQMSPLNIGSMAPNAFLTSVKPVSKYNFVEPIDENVDADERIKILQERLSKLRSTYISIKSDLTLLEKRRKKNKKRGINAKSSSNSSPKNNDNNNCSSSAKEDAQNKC